MDYAWLALHAVDWLTGEQTEVCFTKERTGQAEQ